MRYNLYIIAQLAAKTSLEANAQSLARACRCWYDAVAQAYIGGVAMGG